MGSVCREIERMQYMNDWLDYLVVGMAVIDPSIMEDLEGVRTQRARNLLGCVKSENRIGFLTECGIKAEDLPVKESVIKEANIVYLRREVKRLGFVVRNAGAIGTADRGFVNELGKCVTRLEELTSAPQSA